MKTTYLLPHKYKILGWILFIMGLVGGLFLFVTDYESDVLTVKVFSIYSDDLMMKGNNGFFKIIENSVLDELVSLALIMGGLIIAFTEEKVEDEFIYKLRTDSLVWALIFNYTVLVFAIMFIYGLTFFDVLVFNMFTPLLFFIARFNFLKLKSNNHDE